MDGLSSVCDKVYSSTIKKASNVSQNNDGVKVEGMFSEILDKIYCFIFCF